MFLSWNPVSGVSNVKGQRREPATRGIGIATRRAGWRPFDAPSGSTLLSCIRSGSRYSRLPMGHVISLLSTGWQDGLDAFGCRRGPWSSCYPVILSDWSCAVPVLDPGFWAVERRRSATGASHRQRPQRHPACRLAAVRWTDRFDSPHQYPQRFPMLKSANETSHKSVLDSMTGWTGWF
jgi:hypothetical protein